MSSQRTRSPEPVVDPDEFSSSERCTAVHACADEARGSKDSEGRDGPRRTRSGTRAALRRSSKAICATLFGAGAVRLTDAAPLPGWNLHPCRDAADLLDHAPLSEVVILSPSRAQIRAALDTLSALRHSGLALPVIVLLPLGPARAMPSKEVAEAFRRGATLVLPQSFRPEHIFEVASNLVSDEARETLLSSTAPPPPPPPKPPPEKLLRHGDLRIENGIAFRGENRVELTTGQRRLLEYLLEHAGRAVSKKEVEEHVAGAHLSDTAFRNRILKLRRALEDENGSVIQKSSSQNLSYGIGIA